MLKLTYQDNQPFVWRTGSLSRFFNDKNNEMLTQEVLKQIRIGDVLKYLPSRKGAELIEAEITKIGNKYFYCKIHGKETKFELQTGKEVTDYMGGSLWIDDGSYQEYLELVDLKTKVRDAIRNLDLSKFTTEQLQNILNQLNPAQ